MGKIRDFINRILKRNSQKMIDESDFVHSKNQASDSKKYFESSDKLIVEMELNGEIKKLAQDLTDLDNIAIFQSDVHGEGHIKRVMFNISAISMIDGLNENDRNLLMMAAKLHDIGRINDSKDDNHGKRSAILADNYLSNYSNEDKDLIKFIIEQHSIPDQYNMEAIKKLPNSIQDRYLKMMNYLKDADKLDRVRIMPRSNSNDIRLGDLDPNKLQTETAKKLIYISSENYRKGDNLFSDILNKGKDDTKLFGYEIDSKFIEDVVQFSKYYNLNISQNDVKNNYLMFKSMADQGKFQYLQTLPKEFRNPNSMQIMRALSEIDFRTIYDPISTEYGYGLIIDAVSYLKPNKIREIQGGFKEIQEIFSSENIKFDEKYMDEIFERIKLIPNNVNITREDFNADAFLWYKLGNYKRVEEYITESETTNITLGNVVKLLDKLGSDTVNDLEQNCGADLEILCKLTNKLNNKELEEVLKNTKLQKAITNYQKYQMDSYAVSKKSYERKYFDVMDINILADMPDNLTPDEIYAVKEFIENNPNKGIPINSYEEYKKYNYNLNVKLLDDLKDNHDADSVRSEILFKKFHDKNKLRDTIYFYEKYMPDEMVKSEEFDILKTILESDNSENIKFAYEAMIAKMPNGKSFDSLALGMEMMLDMTAKKDFVLEANKTKKEIEEQPIQYTESGMPYIKLDSTNEFTFNVSSLIPKCSSITQKLTDKFFSSTDELDKQKRRLKLTASEYLHDEILEIQHSLIKNNRQVCTSTISNEFLGHAGPGFGNENELIAAYAPKKQEDVGIMGSEDLSTYFSSEDKSSPNRKRVASLDRRPRSKKVKDLISNTIEEHSEVVIDGNPDYIICFDKINQRSEEFAKKYNIPLILIDAKDCEKNQENKVEDTILNKIPDILSRKNIDKQFEEEYLNKVDLSKNIFANVRQILASQTWRHSDYDEEKMKMILGALSQTTKLMVSKANPKQKRKITDAYDIAFEDRKTQFDKLYLEMDEVDDLKDSAYGRSNKPISINYDGMIH